MCVYVTMGCTIINVDVQSKDLENNKPCVYMLQ